MRAFREKQKQLEYQTPKSGELAEIEKAINDARLLTMLGAAMGDHMDPSSLTGELRLPTEVVDKISKPAEEFTADDLQSCLVLVSKDNLAELLALVKNKDPKVALEAWKIIRDIIYGKNGKSSGSGGGSGGEFTIKLVAPGFTHSDTDE